MRGMALYDDKLYLARATRTWSRSNARTGELAWDVADARRPREQQRPARRERAQSSRAWAAAQQYEEQKCFISAYDAAHRQAAAGGSTPSRATASRAATRWGELPNLFRAGGETWITGSYDPDLNLTYWGTAQAKPWMPVEPRHGHARRGALHELHGRARRRHRQARVALRARAGRSARSRRRVRARARRRRRREPGVHRPARTASSGSSIARRQVPRPQGDAVPERLGELRSARPARRATATTSSSTRSASGSTAARAPRAATTGRR